MCMGTSSSHGGNKDKKGLLPNDYVKPIVSWQATKTGFSKYINGNGGSIKKTASNYVKSSGGSGQLLKSSGSGIRATANISKLFSGIQHDGYEKTFENLGIEYQGKSAKEICSDLVNYISSPSNSKEDAVAREAAINAMSKIYQFIESNELDIRALDRIDNDLVDEVVGTYVECYIWGRILNDLEYCLEKNSDDIERTLQIENEMKSYVSNVVDVAFHSSGMREKVFGNKTISAGVEELYMKCYSALEDMK